MYSIVLSIFIACLCKYETSEKYYHCHKQYLVFMITYYKYITGIKFKSNVPG